MCNCTPEPIVSYAHTQWTAGVLQNPLHPTHRQWAGVLQSPLYPTHTYSEQQVYSRTHCILRTDSEQVYSRAHCILRTHSEQVYSQVRQEPNVCMGCAGVLVHSYAHVMRSELADASVCVCVCMYVCRVCSAMFPRCVAFPSFNDASNPVFILLLSYSSFLS